MEDWLATSPWVGVILWIILYTVIIPSLFTQHADFVRSGISNSKAALN